MGAQRGVRLRDAAARPRDNSVDGPTEVRVDVLPFLDCRMAPRIERNREIRVEQIRLLYSNGIVAVGVTLLAATVLGYLQRGAIAGSTILGWWTYMIVVSAARFALERVYRSAAPTDAQIPSWGTAFITGAVLSGAGWGVAGVLLNPRESLTHQVFLAFVLGGMMLGGASILAARPEAFIPFLLATGLPSAVRFLLLGDSVHIAMGLLAVVFTIATLLTTWQLHRMITSSLDLRFDNRDLVLDLRAAKDRAETLNEELEIRVRERTADLKSAILRLQAEISERERAEQERAKMEIAVRHAQKLEAIGVLAGGIAHDFNNVLTTIAGYTTLARDATPRNSEVWLYLDETLQASTRAADLVRRLLMFSRKSKNSPTLVSAAEVVSDALELVRAYLPSSIEFRHAIDPGSGLILADPDLIHQVILNLCTNAYQAMTDSLGRPSARRTPALEITLSPVEVSPEVPGSPEGLTAGTYVRLTVSDSGAGIPTEIADRIFEPFFTTRMSGQGTGLGLSVVHGVITGYRGMIRFDSDPSKGTTFFVYLPRVIVTDAPTPMLPVPPVRGTEWILFVDDEEQIARMGTRLLQELGYTVTARTNSLEALRLFEQQSEKFDLVICDYIMPHMNGAKLIQRIKQIRADIPVILISGFTDDVVTEDEIERLGIGEYVRKPFSRAILGQTIRKVLAGRLKRD